MTSIDEKPLKRSIFREQFLRTFGAQVGHGRLADQFLFLASNRSRGLRLLPGSRSMVVSTIRIKDFSVCVETPPPTQPQHWNRRQTPPSGRRANDFCEIKLQQLLRRRSDIRECGFAAAAALLESPSSNLPSCFLFACTNGAQWVTFVTASPLKITLPPLSS